jgi:tetratricopeptide (TPR) repeat protein
VRAANAALAYVAYLCDAVWPRNLAFFYPHPNESVSLARAAAAGVLLLAITAACASAWRRRPHWLVGWLWFVGMLVPVIGMHDQARADRYTYLPGIGLSLLACWGVADLAAGSPRVRRALVPAAAVLIAAFGVASRVQLAHWRDAEAIYRRALAVSPDDVRLLYDLGTLLGEQERHDEAAALLSRVLEIEPGYPAALMNLAHVCLAQGRYDEAISHYLAVVEIYPRQPMIHYNLGVAYARAWKLREAISHFERALEREPDLHAAREGLIGALLKQGRSDEALTQLHELLARSPDHPRARELLERLAPGGAG